MSLLSWEEDEDAGGDVRVVWKCWEGVHTFIIGLKYGEIKGESPKPYFSALLIKREEDWELRFHQAEAYEHLLLLSGEEMASNVVSFSLGKLRLNLISIPYMPYLPYHGKFAELLEKEASKFEAVKKEWKNDRYKS